MALDLELNAPGWRQGHWCELASAGRPDLSGPPLPLSVLGVHMIKGFPLFARRAIAISLLIIGSSAPLVGQVAKDAQDTVAIRVDASAKLGPYEPISAYFGYDEPNYTYMPNGKKLLGELVQLSSVPVYIRVHNLLTTGDGTPALKWGSTNAYTEDPSGNPVYDWTILDKIFDTIVEAGARPFVEVGFMPKALSIKPEPYQHHWHPGAKYDEVFTGWAYPPKDYNKWAELVRRWARHSVERYGRSAVASWYWEVWNEPDIPYWRGSAEEYDKLYDFTADALKGVLPEARVGGPATTGPGDSKAAAYLRQFLQHCAHGTNYATGKTGAPLDFISYHAKGASRMIDGHVQMGVGKNLQDVAAGLELLTAFPEYRALPVFLTESDPEGCAACSARVSPQNAYRNGPIYPCHVAEALNNTLKLAGRYQAKIDGLITWAFEYEDQPWFEGFRTLATNGVDKPVLNVFRMLGMMRGDRLKVESDGALGLDAILRGGVRDKPDIDAMAAISTIAGHRVDVMIWNYHDDDLPASDAPVKLTIGGLPREAQPVLARHYRVDGEHSNAYALWKRMGSPAQPSAEERSRLETAGQLELYGSPAWLSVREGKVELTFLLPRHAVSLIELAW
jgi:xylan 1,4-beta-xylosidase